MNPLTPSRDTGSRHAELVATGFDERGGARDRASLFAAAGLEWPGSIDPEAVHARQTDYPFSVDVSNNRVLAAVDRAGLLRRVVTALDVEDVRGRAIPGVYVHKQMAYCEGRIGLHASVDGTPLDAPALSFLDGTIPVFQNREAGVAVRRTVFAPQHGEDRPLQIVILLEAENHSDEAHELHVAAIDTAAPRAPWATMVTAVTLIGDGATVAGAGATLVLEPAERATVGAVIDLSATGQPPLPTITTTEQLNTSLETTRAARTGTLGTLSVPEDPWYGEVVTRAAELARQSMLLLPDGRSAGSFWGSNANPLPDVWTRDFGYGALGLLDSTPDLALAAIAFLADYGLPDAAWEREADLHPDATGLEHSLGNACLAAVLAALFIQRHGSAQLRAECPSLPDYSRRLADALLKSRPGPGALYRTLYISDGPSRGDFHTGSNILAWRAALALSTDLAAALPDDQAAQLADLADELKRTIDSTCVRVVDGHAMFVEGTYSNGGFVSVHDGEESDLTLASVYGFAERDDDRVRAHAKWAHSPGNPYYARVTSGVDFWDWDDYNGVTYPGHIHRLAATGSRTDLKAALHEIRRTTDLDGSFWWWPFKHGETDSERVKRGLGKCGWSAGAFVSYLLHDIVGVRRDAERRALTVAPYTPWRGLTWKGLAFIDGTIDVTATTGAVATTNHTGSTITVTLQVALEPGEMIEDITLNGANERYQSEVMRIHDSTAVATTTTLEPGATATLRVTTSGGPEC